MANSLANTANLLLVCIFYAPLIPPVILIGMFGMLFSYHIEKHLFISRYERPEELSKSMIFFFANLVPYFIWFWAFASFHYTNAICIQYTDGYLLSKYSVTSLTRLPSLVTLIIASIYILLPIRSFINAFFSGKDDEEGLPYSQV
jgi:hypothetical protein